MQLQSKRGSSRSDESRHDDSRMLNIIGHPIVPEVAYCLHDVV
jgi:hypothetical protein